jgi:hypothetical protein
MLDTVERRDEVASLQLTELPPGSPSIAVSRQSATNRVHTLRIARPLSLRKSAIVL